MESEPNPSDSLHDAQMGNLMGFVMINKIPEHIISLNFAQNKEIILAATSSGVRMYLTKCFSCIGFTGMYTISFYFNSQILWVQRSKMEFHKLFTSNKTKIREMKDFLPL